MPRVFFFDKKGSILSVEDPAPSEIIREQILAKNWLPPWPQFDDDYAVTVIGDNIFIAPLDCPGNNPVSSIPQISRRERQVLEELVEGKEFKEIARTLSISVATVTEYAGSLRNKFNTRSLRSVVARAVAMGICKPKLD